MAIPYTRLHVYMNSATQHCIVKEVKIYKTMCLTMIILSFLKLKATYALKLTPKRGKKCFGELKTKNSHAKACPHVSQTCTLAYDFGLY